MKYATRDMNAFLFKISHLLSAGCVGVFRASSSDTETYFRLFTSTLASWKALENGPSAWAHTLTWER